MRKVNKVVAAAIAASMMVLSVSGLFTANEISKDEIMPSSELVQEESTEHMQVSGNTLEPEEQETTDEALNYEETSQSDEAIAYDEELTIEPRNTDVPPDFVSVKERNWDIIGEEDPGYGNYVSFMEEAFFNGYMNIDGVNTSTGNNIIIWGLLQIVTEYIQQWGIVSQDIHLRITKDITSPVMGMVITGVHQRTSKK